MSDINQKRRFVSDLYPGDSWKQRVAQMEDDQIIAIFLKTKDNQKPIEQKPGEEKWVNERLF